VSVAPLPERRGRLTLVRTLPSKPGQRYARGLWRCDCGNELTARLDNVRHGGVKSCGHREPAGRRAAFTRVPTLAQLAAVDPGAVVRRNNAARAACDAELMRRLEARSA
jgi:hypothetical protein